MIAPTKYTIKALPTIFNGVRFRSRLEARWAVFFATLGIAYEYEPERFLLGHAGKTMVPIIPGESSDKPEDNYELGEDMLPQSIEYTPDFRVVKQAAWSGPEWIEVKGVETEIDRTAMYRLCLATNKQGLILNGIPYPPEGADEFWFCDLEWSSPYPLCGDNRYFFCECIYCGCIGYEFDGRSARIDCCKENHHGDKEYNISDRIRHALLKASSYNFEFQG